MVAARINEHLSVHGMQETLQSAYKAFHSTESALLRIHNDLLTAMNRKQGSYLVLLDLLAAFDTVNHELLLHRLKARLGIGGTALAWFRSYLTNRTQEVMVGDTLSALVYLLFGVPQGSVLGPLLFSIYTHPLGDIIGRHGIGYYLYADDTQLYLSFDLKNHVSEMEARHKLECCIAEIQQWMTVNKLKLNGEKTEITLFSSSFHRGEIFSDNIQVSGVGIFPASSARSLGVIFDNHLTLDAHVRKVCSTAYFHLHSILPPPQHTSTSATFLVFEEPLHLIRQCHWSTHVCPQGLKIR